MLTTNRLKITAFMWLLCCPLLMHALTYQHFNSGRFTTVHVLIVDPNEHEIRPVRALGNEISRESVLTLTKRHGAIAGINGGFWKQNGQPAGLLKIDQQWHGTALKPRGAIGWSINSNVLIDRVLTNRQFFQGEACIHVTPLSHPSQATTDEWNRVENIVGGSPVMIQDGILIEDYSCEKTSKSFLVKKHPRTAVGIRTNGEWVFVVVDGQFFGLFGGLTVKELAALMLRLGCVKALNLDGGGSSTMVLNNSVINQPCGDFLEKGKHIEIVSDAILIFPKK